MSSAVSQRPELGSQFIAPILAHLHEKLVLGLAHAQFSDASYARGAAGQLLSLAALAMHPAAPPPDLDLLEEGVNRLLLSVPQMPHGLFHGAEGVLFAALEIDRHFGFNLVEDFATEFDACFYSHLSDRHELPEHFDLISGIAGLLVYACYRAQQTGDSWLVPLCVNQLADMVTNDERGASWFTPAERIRGTPIGNAHPLGCIDLGIAHGQPGALGAIALAVLVGGDTRASTHALLRDGIRFLRGQELVNGLPHFSCAAGSNMGSGCAWCYGDLGMVGTLRLAAQASADPALDAWGDAILHSLKHRTPDALGFKDPFLCHGACGAAWLLRQLDGGVALNDLAQVFETAGLAHYQNYQPGDRIGLLEGVAGFALTLAEQDGWRSQLNWALPLLPGNRSLVFDASTAYRSSACFAPAG
ncbi:MAG: hypothetical protein HY253_03500 [Burkholderiales bacterium]|nr:hypothetical protein [Burkholderiales bacterium]